MIEEISFIIANLMNVFAMLDIWLILFVLFDSDMRITPRNLAVAASVFAILFVGITYAFEGHNNIIFGFMCTYNVFVTCILTKKHRVKTMLLSIPAVLVYSQFNFFFSLIFKLLNLENIYVLKSAQGELAMDYVISDGILFFLLVCIARSKMGRSHTTQLSVAEGVLLSVFCAFSPMIVWGFEWFEGQANDVLYSITWVLFMVILNIAVIYAIAHRKRATYYRKLSEDYKREFEAEYSFFADYKEQQQDTIKFRHDWKNHMLLLQEMLNQEEYEKAEDYFKELTATTTSSVYKIATGNEFVDMILSTKTNVLAESEIVLQCKGDFSGMDFMRNTDCCILLSNLLDNAIEANKQIDGKRYIELLVRKTAGMTYVEMKNPMEGTLQRKDNQIVSTKPKREYHGIGLQNVYEILEQYKGKANITTEQNEYTIQMVFPV